MALLNSKVAIVTGAGQGVGQGIAIKFAKEGAKVVVAERTAKTGEQVVEKIKALTGDALFVQCDVGNKQDVKRMVARTAEIYGTVDILVNNAQSWGSGETSPYPIETPMEKLDDATFETTFRTGMMGTLWCSQAVFPYMKAKGWGRIINFSSGAALEGEQKGMVDYCCTKAAIREFTWVAAREWGPHGITVNAICPRVVTETLAAFFQDHPGLREQMEPTLVMGRFAEAEKDVGGLCVMLASDYADMVSGMTLLIGESHTL